MPKPEPVASVSASDSPELVALRFKEKTFKEKIERVGKLDPSSQGTNHDHSEVKRTAERHLSEVQAEIKKLSK